MIILTPIVANPIIREEKRKNGMKESNIGEIRKLSAQIEEPENLFRGIVIPANNAFPNNIVMFRHNWIAAAPNSHSRYTLVVPFDPMIYYVDQKEFTLSPGTILLIKPYQIRFLNPSSTGFDRLFITFDLPSSQTYLPTSLLNHISEAGWGELKKITTAYQNARAFDASLALVSLLCRLDQHPISSSGVMLSGVAAKAVAYVNEHLATPFENIDISKNLNISLSHLRRIFRTETGISLGQYAARHRIDAAKHQLQNTSLRIEEIAAACGYRDVYVFSHAFKRAEGVSPSLYRTRFIS